MKPKCPKNNLQKQGRISTKFRGGGGNFLAGQNIDPCLAFSLSRSNCLEFSTSSLVFRTCSLISRRRILSSSLTSLRASSRACLLIRLIMPLLLAANSARALSSPSPGFRRTARLKQSFADCMLGSTSFSMWESSRITVLASELTELCLEHVSSSIDAQFAKLSCAQKFSSNTTNKKYCRLVSLQFPPNYSTMDERR